MNRTCWAARYCALFIVAAYVLPAEAQSSPERTGVAATGPLSGSRSPEARIQRELQPLSSQLPDIRPRGGLRPADASEGVFSTQETQYAAHRGDGWSPIQYHWAASELRHRPLYFEDAMLERHGQTRRPLVQPLASGARFFLTAPVLPYAMVVDRPCQVRSTLGHFRPGSGAPLLLQRPPLQADAGVVEAGTWVGLIFLIP